MSLTISTIIPTYNVAEHLSQAIASVLCQSRQPAEILIVDDCSTDQTLEVAHSFADSRIKILRTPRNSGSGPARNVGIRAATSDLVAMLDADDFWSSDHLQVVGGLLDEHCLAQLAFSSTQAFGDENWVWPIRIAPHTSVSCFWECLPRTIVPHMNLIARREALLEVGGYTPALRQSQDYDLLLRFSHRFPLICTDQVTSYYRRHSGSITMRHPTNAQACIYQSRYLFRQQLEQRADAQELTRFDATCLSLWAAELERCALHHHWHMMDFHLDQARYVHGSQEISLGWKLRRMAGTLHQVWQYANRQLRLPFRPAGKEAA